MDQRIKKKWIRALKSGKYKQTTAVLKKKRKDGKFGFCCLGVLCDLHAKETKTKWDNCEYFGNDVVLSIEVQNWAGISSPQGDYIDVDEYRTLSDDNDEGKKFSTIAKIIEEHF